MQYFMKTQRCKFGFKCRFNHPRDKLETVVGSTCMRFGTSAFFPMFVSVSFLILILHFLIMVQGATENPGALPERPFEPQCAVRYLCFFYTGNATI